jgi:NAD(P)-dependent dehydrogenase (short-subunit alcohol dehydrogenase family)
MTAERPPTVLVTGASRGIGRAVATRLAAAGRRVVGTSRDPSRAAPAPFPLVPLDVRDGASVERCLAEVGPVDALVNNAGYALVGAVEETSVDEARAQMETNFFGALRLTLAVLPAMRRRGAGRIVAVSSLAGVAPPPFLGAYAASKHALEALCESLSFEARPHGVRVTLVEFDSMRTGIAFAAPARPEAAYAAPRERMLERLVRGSHETGADPDAVARAVEAILDDDAPPLRCVVGEHSARVVAARRALSEPDFDALVRRELALWPGAAP